jgi:AraC-like DNA-binding protein
VSAPVNNGSAYAAVAPPAALRPFVERLWLHRIDGPPPTGGRRLLPDGRMHLVWVSGLGVKIAGPQTHYTRPIDRPQLLVVGATFHPGAAPHLLRTPASAMVNDNVPLDAIDARLAARLDDRLGHARDAREGLAAFGEELSQALRAHADPDPSIRQAVRLLNRTATSVADAATRAFVSERELQRRFRDHIGYGPKTLQRVLRFQRFMRHVAAPEVDLAAVAAMAGYADQSHLTREARRLAGLTPRQLIGWTH